MNQKVYFALAVLVLVALACGINNVPTPTLPSPVIINPQPTTGGPSSGLQVLFQDDFSNVNSGWDRFTGDKGSTDYASGGYRINITAPMYSYLANPYQSFQNDVRVEVDATKIGGPNDNAFGVICRYQDLDNFYFFYISSDGYVGIGINNSGTKSIISSPDGNLVADSNINMGAASNHIRADCTGTNLTLYVNGSQSISASDATFTRGDVGLIARSFDTAGTDILFKNFFVYKP
jgi:hypothetical protein